MNEREDIRTRLYKHNLTFNWLIDMLRYHDIVTTSSIISGIFAGTRNGKKADEIVSESQNILDRYEAYLEKEVAG